MQLIVPSASWYEPAGHGAHAAAREADAKVPAAHGRGQTLPVGAQKPGSVGVHSAALVKLVALLYVPSSHGSAAAAPTLQYEPPTQARQAVAFTSGWCVPAAHGLHDALPVLAAYWPGLHATGGAPPPAHEYPAAHSKHSGTPLASDTLPNFPGALVAGSSRLLPTGQKRPSAHRMHAAAPLAFWNVPDGHRLHLPLRSCAAWLPAAHGVGMVEPVVHACPAGHASHLAALVRLVRLEYEPSLHGSAAAAPSTQYAPCSHALQLVVPSASWYEPAGHGTHAAARGSAADVPAAHARGEKLPVGA